MATKRLACELDIYTRDSNNNEIVQTVKNFNPAITDTAVIKSFALELNDQLTRNTYSYTVIKTTEQIL